VGQPIKRGQLKLKEGVQRISFPPRRPPAALPRAEHAEPRRRRRSSHRPDGDGGGAAAARAFNAAAASEVAPITLSTFHVLEHQPKEGPEMQQYLSDLALPKSVQPRPACRARMRMNGLWFRKGLGVGASSRIDLQLAGNWNLLRADLGVDDSCRNAGGLQFQVWSGERLLYDSGLIRRPAWSSRRSTSAAFPDEPAHAGCAGQQAGAGLRQLGQRRPDRHGGQTVSPR
jgi:hypothetical protein